LDSGQNIDYSLLEDPRDDAAAHVFANLFNFLGGPGSFISNTIIYYLDRDKNRKMVTFVKEIAKELTSLQVRINHDFINHEDFKDMTEDILDKVAHTHQQEKLDSFKAIFENAVIFGNYSYDDIEEITTLVNGWQSAHIIMLKIMSDIESENHNRYLSRPQDHQTEIEIEIDQRLHELLPDWDDEKLGRIMKRLVFENIINTPSTLSMINGSGPQNLNGKITEFGNKVIGFLKSPIEFCE
jgi:hypothetical protein